jgi:hypothetical protein
MAEVRITCPTGTVVEDTTITVDGKDISRAVHAATWTLDGNERVAHVTLEVTPAGLDAVGHLDGVRVDDPTGGTAGSLLRKLADAGYIPDRDDLDMGDDWFDADNRRIGLTDDERQLLHDLWKRPLR